MVRDERPTRIRVLETFAVFAAVALIASLITRRQAFSFLALGIILAALFAKHAAELLTVRWLKFSAVLSILNNTVILTLLFYLVLTPLALAYRLFNRDPLGLGRGDNGSFYCERNHRYSGTDLEKMW